MVKKNILGSSQVVRQGPLKPPFVGSIPTSPAYKISMLSPKE